jgi:hypothetical protein
MTPAAIELRTIAGGLSGCAVRFGYGDPGRELPSTETGKNSPSYRSPAFRTPRTQGTTECWGIEPEAARHR